jgi:hypothetical protein
LFDGIPDPVFILSAPRSFSSVVCAMLGQHPQMYGLPELHLLEDESMEGWWQRSAEATFQLAHGLLRVVAEVFFGGQSELTVAHAAAWLRRRRCETSGMVFEQIARAVSPRILVEKSPSMVYTVGSMRRVFGFFPQAKFVHLVRHPCGYCESVLKYLDLLSRPNYQPRDRPRSRAPEAPEWIRDLAHFPDPLAAEEAGRPEDLPLDPQGGWYVLNTNVAAFLSSIPAAQWMRVRGEDLLMEPERHLSEISRWLGLRVDGAAIEEMKQPDRSPYARFGPPGARLGNDILFLERPAVRASRIRRHSLEGPPAWRPEIGTLHPQVVSLARSMGYE